MKNKIYMTIVLIGFLTSSCSQKASDKIDAYGNFEAVETIISSQTAGQILKLDLEEGMSFAQPTLVGFVDTSLLSLQLNKIEANRGVLNAQIDAARFQIEALALGLELIQSKKKRILYMFKKKAVTPQDRDEIITAEKVSIQKIEGAKSSLLALHSRHFELDAAVAEIHKRIKDSRIMVPEAALVLEKYVENFEYVVPSQPLFKLANPDYMILRVYVSESQLASLKLGQNVQVFFDDNSTAKQAQISGQLSWIGEQAIFTPKTVETKEERVNLVFPIKIKVKNDGRPKLGLPAQVIFSGV